MLHQGTGAGTDPASDINVAAGSTVSRGVAAVTKDGEHGAGIEPAGIGRCRAFDNDFGAIQAERADPLPRVLDAKLQGLTIFGPQRAADVVVT